VETDCERALRLCVALTFWWKARGLFLPAERGFARALESADDAPASLRTRALWGRGYLAAFAGNIEVALTCLQQACAMAEELGDESMLARGLMAVGVIQIFPDPVGGRATSERARELARASGDDWTLALAILNIAWTHLLRLELDDADRALDEALPLTEKLGYPEMQAWYFLSKAFRPWMAADAEQLVTLTEGALTAARAAGEPSTEALAQCLRAQLELAQGNPQAAVERLQPTRARMVAAGAGLALGYTEFFLAPAQGAVGAIAEARAALEQLIAGGMDLGYQLGSATVNLADILRIAGEPSLAEARAAEALEVGERIGSPLVITPAKEILGRVAAGRAEWGRAETLLHEALATRTRHEMLLYLPQTLDALAEVAAGLESYEEAARTLGAAQRARAELGLQRWAPDAPRFAQLESTLRQALGDEGYELMHTEGQELAPGAAVVWLQGTRGQRKRPARGWESLTPTELRVVQFVAEGLTNPDIGQRMFISRGTVKVHLSHIFAKLGITTRAELASEATRRALAS
jgi:DNA-binding CsgD family transcriptional regulator